jgi:ubiquinone/menaquinone biosynthesis C-methylase UbiE
MKRIPEPELMTPHEETHYQAANYAAPHEAFAHRVVATAGPLIGAVLGDLGTGPGDIPLRIAGKRPGWQIVGIDASDHMLAFARRDRRNAGLARPIQWVRADVLDTRLPDQSFDVLISNSVLHHLRDPLRFWREVARLSKPSAVVLVRDLRRPADEEGVGQVVARHVSAESPVVQEHYRSSLHSAYTAAELRAQLEAAAVTGLTVRKFADRYLDVCGRLGSR